MEFPRPVFFKLPEKMDKFVRGLAGKHQVYPSMVTPYVLAILASISQKKFDIVIKSSKEIVLRTSLSFFSIIVAESGVGKTQLFKELIDPLNILIEDKNKKIKEKNESIKIKNKYIDKIYKIKEKDAIKLGIAVEDAVDILAEVENSKDDLLPMEVIYTTNSTPQGILKALMTQKGNRFSILDSEGSMVNFLCQRSTITSQINQAFDYEPVAATRATKDINEPIEGIITMLLCMQPVKFEKFKWKNYLWEEGVLPRILPFFGDKLLLTWLTANIVLDESDIKYYKDKLAYIHNYNWNIDENGKLISHDLSLDNEALEKFHKYENELKSFPSTYSKIDAWLRKAPIILLHIAGLFHIYETDGDPVALPISADCIKFAGELIMELIPNVEFVREFVAPTPNEKTLKQVIRWLRRRYGSEKFKLREIYNITGLTEDEVYPVIWQLLDEGVLVEIPDERHARTGRNPSSFFCINMPLLMIKYPPER